MSFQEKYSAAEIEQINKKFYEKNEKDFQAFKKAANKGDCWLCKRRLDYPCR